MPNPTIVCHGKTVTLVRDEFLEPTKCPFCNGEVGRVRNGAVTECKNPECPKKSDGKIKCWFRKVEILGCGDAVREALRGTFDVTTPDDIYRLGREVSVEDLREMMVGDSKFGGSADNLVAEIDKKRNLPLSIFLGSLGIDGLGRRRVEVVCEKTDQLRTLEDWRSGKLRDPKLAQSISAPNDAERWANGIDKMAAVIDGLLANGVRCLDFGPTSQVAPTGCKLEGRLFVFTGAIEKVDNNGKRFTREMMHETVLSNGGKVTDKVKTKETILVQANPNSSSSKSKDAKAVGATIMSEVDFWGLVVA